MSEAEKQTKSIELAAVVDRFEEKMAVLLVGDDEVKVNFPKRLLSELNLKEGDWLKINVAYDAQATQEAMREAQELLESIRQKNK